MTTLIDRAAPQGELDSFLSAFSGAAAEAEAMPAPRGGELDAGVPDTTEVPIRTKPRRPYTPYNLFYLLERELVVQGNDPSVAEQRAEERAKMEADPTYLAKVGKRAENDIPLPPRYEGVVMLPWWFEPNLKEKRKHRKTLGTISFKDLTEIISKNWATIDGETKEYCTRVSEIGRKRYKEDVTKYNALHGHQQNAASPAQPPLLIDEEMTKAASSELTKRQRKPTWKLQSPGLDGDAIARPLVQQQNAIQPTPQDVLLRFGNQHEPMANSHAGTGHVKLIVDALALESYASLRRAARVQEFVNGVISHVHSQGGRFLQRDAGVGDWIEVEDVKARKMLSDRLEKRNKRAAEAQSRLGAVHMDAAAVCGGTGGGCPPSEEEPKSIRGTMDFVSGCFSPPQSSYFVQGNDVFMG